MFVSRNHAIKSDYYYYYYHNPIIIIIIIIDNILIIIMHMFNCPCSTTDKLCYMQLFSIKTSHIKV